jgi:hypothetical protein
VTGPRVDRAAYDAAESYGRKMLVLMGDEPELARPPTYPYARRAAGGSTTSRKRSTG